MPNSGPQVNGAADEGRSIHPQTCGMTKEPDISGTSGAVGEQSHSGARRIAEVALRYEQPPEHGTRTSAFLNPDDALVPTWVRVIINCQT